MNSGRIAMRRRVDPWNEATGSIGKHRNARLMSLSRSAITASKIGIAPKRTSYALALCVIAFASAFAGCGASQAQMISTLPTFNPNGGAIANFGDGGATSTYGETFTAQSTNATQSVSFELKSFNSNSAANIRAFVYQWNGMNAVGSALFTTPILTIPASAQYILFTAAGTGQSLVTGTQYVAFFTTLNVAQGANNGQFQFAIQAKTYVGGQPQYTNNGSVTAAWDGRNFTSNTEDFAFAFVFAPTLVPALTVTTNLVALAQTQNQRAVAGGLTNAFNNANLGTTAAPNGAPGALAVAFNNTPSGAIPRVLDSLSGEGIAAAQNVAYRSSSLVTSTITDQTTFYNAGSSANSVRLTDAVPRFLAYAPVSKSGPIVTHDAIVPANRTWRAWTTGFGAADNIRGDGNLGTAAQTNAIYGGTLGVDYQFASNYLAGVALGGSNGTFSVPGRATFGSTTGGHAAFYTLANFGAFYGAGSTTLSYFGNKTTRNIAGFGGLAGETDRGNFGSREVRSRIEFGWHTAAYGAVLTPFVALEIAQLRSNGFTESSLSGPGLLALNVQGQTGASVPASIGARLSQTMLLGNGMAFTPTLQAAYVYEFAPQRNQIGALVNLPGSTFLVDGARASRNAAQVKAGAELALSANLRAFAMFDGELSGVEQVYAGKGGLRYTW